ncbi:MAG: hypothetical protein HYZ67_01860 [Chlamydiae bacterium]|nr:hypothetical protein [Chlamydiota bacterium]
MGRLPESFQGKSSERFTERAFDMEYDDSETLTKYTFDRTPHGVRDIFEFNASRPGDIDILGRYVHFDENHTLTTQDGGLMKYTQDRTLQYDILDRVQSFQETTCVEGFPGCSQTNFTANRFDLDRPWVLMDFTEKVQYKEVQDDGSIITLIETIIRTTQEMDFDFNIPLKFTDVIVKEEPGKTTTQTVVTTQTLDVHGLLVHFEEVTDEIVETSSTKTHQKISVIQDITNDIQQRRPLGWTLEETTTPFNITTGDVTGTTVRTLDHTVTDLEDLLPNKYAQMIHEFDRSVGIHALSFLTGDAFGLAGVLNSNARTLGLELELKPFENVTGIHYTSQGNTPISQASLPDSFKREALPTISSSLREDVTRYEETVPFGKDIFRRPLEEYHAVQFPERAIYEYREFYYDILSHLRVVILGMHEERRLGELEGVPLQRPIQAKKGKRAKIEPAFIPLPSRVFDRFEVGGESIKAFFFDLWMESNLYWKVLQHESYGTQMRTQLISRQPSYTLFEGILPLKGKVSKIIGEEKWVIQTKVPLPFSQAWKIYRNSFGGVEKILRSFSIQIFARENILSAEKFHRGMIPSGLNDLKNQLSRQMSILSKPASREPTLEEYTERAVAVQKWVRTFQKLKSLYPEVDVNMLKDKARQEVPRFEEKTFQKLSDLAQRIPGNQLTLKDVHPIILSQEPKFLPMEDLMNQGLLNSNAPVQVAPSREPMEHPADASGSSGQGGAK